jgi:hypothetical protein
MRSFWNLYTLSQATHRPPSVIMDIAGWVQRRYPGYDGQRESYSFDSAVTYAGRVIENQLNIYDDLPGPGKTNKRVRRYESVKDVFDVIDGKHKPKSRTRISVEAFEASGLAMKGKG